MGDKCRLARILHIETLFRGSVGNRTLHIRTGEGEFRWNLIVSYRPTHRRTLAGGGGGAPLDKT